MQGENTKRPVVSASVTLLSHPEPLGIGLVTNNGGGGNRYGVLGNVQASQRYLMKSFLDLLLFSDITRACCTFYVHTTEKMNMAESSGSQLMSLDVVY